MHKNANKTSISRYDVTHAEE